LQEGKRGSIAVVLSSDWQALTVRIRLPKEEALWVNFHDMRRTTFFNRDIGMASLQEIGRSQNYLLLLNDRTPRRE
jgi:hypothetical protein